MAKRPGLTRPTTSPATAESTVSRSRPKNRFGRDSRSGAFRRVLVTCMSFDRTPEQTRTNAMRSRCRGFMFAWILKTKPLKSGSAGSTVPALDGRGCGGGANSVSPRRNGSRPKFESALPKNTGVCSARR